MANKEDEYKKLRKFLNNAIRGKNTDAILRSVATGPVHLVDNVEAVNDSLYIVSAKEKFLDQRLADRGIVRPSDVGLSDEVFRDIGIEVANRKQVRDLVHQLLRILYGEVFTRATSTSAESETYNLEDGDNLLVSFDGQDPIELIFSASQFSNINAATAQEVADAITKSIRKIGADGAGFTVEDGVNTKVVIISPTDGPSSSVRIQGGKAQNVLKFDELRPTSGDASTQWTLTQEAGGKIRATWTGGADPSLGKVKVGDYINVYGTAFDILNRGTFDVEEIQGGTVGNSYVEFVNPNGIAETVSQGTADAALFFNPLIRVLTSEERYAAAFQTSPRTLEVFMPATTKIVRRNRRGAAHIYESGPSNVGQEGPYVYDTTVGFVIGEQAALTTEELDASSDSILFVDDASEFPDEAGKVIIGLGTSHQEGPVPYISKPSANTLRINPSYKFQKEHPIGTDVALVAQESPANPAKDGSDTPFYLTDSVAGRIYAENLIKEITATGIVVIIYILYPNDIGLGKWGDQVNSEKYYIWGTEEDIVG
tara:strand:- start:6143 stop:7762 length:1620 start_codon:yes stop_codon:yes gene_type:complete